MTSPGKVWYIALKLGVDFSTCNKVLFATQLSKVDNCVAFFVGNGAKSVPARKSTNRKDHKWR